MAAVAYARCPNSCSNQGMCGPNSQCQCYRNYQGSDCSERVCFYASAFVDTPLGDANADGSVGMSVTFEEQTQQYVLEGYSINYGSARPIDGISESNRWDEAHFYRECSNKGLCNRKTGQCDCFPGYEGEGCQRTSCPGTGAGITCSGHGLCLSAYSSQPTYSLWDKDKTMKCECDAGYTGPDCSLRQCPSGADPVKHSDKVTSSLQKISWGTIGYTNTFLASEDNRYDEVISGPVYWTVTVQDEYGDEWVTNTLSIDYTTTCDTTHANRNCISMPIFNQPDDLSPGVAASEDLGTASANTDFMSDTTASATSFLVKSNPLTDWYHSSNIADDLNMSLQALPNGAVKSPKVWMWYTRANPHVLSTEALIYADYTQAGTGDPSTTRNIRSNDIKYPEDPDTATGYEGVTVYWNSVGTRYPDFNSNGHLDKKWWDCGRIDGREDVNNDGIYTATDGDDSAQNSDAQSGRVSLSADSDAADVKSVEGLCLYISSENSRSDVSQNYKVTYSYNSYVFVDIAAQDTDGEVSASYYGQLQVGQSYSVVTDIDSTNYGATQKFADGADTDASGLINQEVPLVTVEEVGLYRYWDVNVDGYPAKTYAERSVDVNDITKLSIVSTFETHECSKRGLCDQLTGECQCFSGYTGTSCNAQNAISYSS